MVLGGFLIKQYGSAKEDLGAKTEKADQVIAVTETKETDRKTNESIDRETQNMDDLAIDRDLSNLGIMRRNEDY